LNPQTISSDTTTNGIIIDTAGYESLEFVIQTATITLGTITPVIQESDDSGLADPVTVTDASGFLLGTLADATFAATDDNKTKRIGYAGKKRYVRLSVVTASSANLVVGAVAILGAPLLQNVDLTVV
jgi:hypothetical protein